MKKVVVVGLGKSGMAAARILAEQGETIFITEIRDDIDTSSAFNTLVKDGIVHGCNAELGCHTRGLMQDAELVVVSPGVRSDSLAIKLAEEMNIPVISELELGYSLCAAPIIAVTGTSGKTTVTTLIGEMLVKAGLDAIVCGNIGNPLSGEVKRIKKDSIVVAEVSSFQLERIKYFKPRHSIILNISENHLDRHKTMDEYISFKSRIFSNQDNDGLVFLNGKDPRLRALSRQVKTTVEFFDEFKNFGRRYNIKNENYLAAMSLASIEGVSEELMLDVISRFKGIEHRLEYVGDVGGVAFINDSKATTVSSVEWALRSLDGRIILIMGGRYKGGDFERLKDLIEKKVALVIAIGEARSMIKETISPFGEVLQEEDLYCAVHKAFEKAKAGFKILLSPGCSSFDMFRSYEERGRAFKEIMKSLYL